MRRELKLQARELLKGKIGNIFVVFLVGNIVLLMFSLLVLFLPTPEFIVTIIEYIIAGMIMVSTIYMFKKVTRNEKLVVEDWLYGFQNNALTNMLVYILMVIFIFLWTLLLIIPGIIKGLAYSMSFYLTLNHPELKPLEVITLSRKIMKGHKWEYFVLGLSFLGWIILSMFTFGILLVYVLPYIETTNYLYFQRLEEEYIAKNGSLNV